MPGLSSIARYLWAAPTTAIGVMVVLAGLRHATIRLVDGVLEAHGPTLAWILRTLTFVPGGAAALTLGHVVIGRDHASLESTRAHERVHVRQCEAWGPLFVPAYLAASLAAGARGRNFYYDNRFEVQAYAVGVELASHRRTAIPGQVREITRPGRSCRASPDRRRARTATPHSDR